MIWGLIFLGIASGLNYFANIYAEQAATNSVTDLILSHTPVFNVDFIMTYGVTAFGVFVFILLLTRPAMIPFATKSMALFIIIRAVFISLTHIAQFTPQASLNPSAILGFFGDGNGGGLFFSGHTGLPFLLCLMFWDDRVLRYLFLTASVVFGTSMLLGHLHYSIDVLAAFFITYAIYHMTLLFFPQDRQLFTQGFEG